MLSASSMSAANSSTQQQGAVADGACLHSTLHLHACTGRISAKPQLCLLLRWLLLLAVPTTTRHQGVCPRNSRPVGGTTLLLALQLLQPQLAK